MCQIFGTIITNKQTIPAWGHQNTTPPWTSQPTVEPRKPRTLNITSSHPLISRREARRIFRFYSTVVFKAAATFLKSIPSRLVLGLELVSVSSILSQHGVKLSNFSWAVWRKIIYRFLLLRHCILSSWKSVILIIYQNKRNPKQILNISRHGRLPRRWNYYWDSWLAGWQYWV